MSKSRTEKKKGRKCPVCGRPQLAQFKPFCSKRCADADLAHWFKGNYAIPGPRVSDEKPADNETETEDASEDERGGPARAKN